MNSNVYTELNGSNFESDFRENSSQTEDFETEVYSENSGAENTHSILFSEIESDEEPDSEHLNLIGRTIGMKQVDQKQTNQLNLPFDSNFNYNASMTVTDQNGGLANQMHPVPGNPTETNTQQPNAQISRNQIPLKYSASNKHRQSGINVQFQQTGSGIKRKSIETNQQVQMKRQHLITLQSNHQTEPTPTQQNDPINKRLVASDIHKSNNMNLEAFSPRYSKPIQPLNESEFNVFKVIHSVTTLDTFRF